MTHVLTEQLRLSLHFEQCMSLHIPVPLSSVRQVSFQNKSQPFCSLHKKQGLGNLFLSPLYFKTCLQRLAHRQQAQLHFEMCAD